MRYRAAYRGAGEDYDLCSPRVCRELTLLQGETSVLLEEMVGAAGRDERRLDFQGHTRSYIDLGLR